MYVNTSLASPFCKVVVPRALRFICLGLLISRWRLWPWFILIFPVAVRPKRFLAPLLVLSLGISTSAWSRALYRCPPAKASKAQGRGDGQAVAGTVGSRGRVKRPPRRLAPKRSLSFVG